MYYTCILLSLHINGSSCLAFLYISVLLFRVLTKPSLMAFMATQIVLYWRGNEKKSSDTARMLVLLEAKYYQNCIA